MVRVRRQDLGRKYKDMISGLVGTVTARTDYLFGCVWVLLEVDLQEDQMELKEIWMDTQRLVAVREAKKKGARKTSRGGLVKMPTKRSTPNCRDS